MIARVYKTHFWYWGISVRTFREGCILTLRLGKRQLVIGKKVRYFSKLNA